MAALVVLARCLPFSRALVSLNTFLGRATARSAIELDVASVARRARAAETREVEEAVAKEDEVEMLLRDMERVRGLTASSGGALGLDGCIEVVLERLGKVVDWERGNDMFCTVCCEVSSERARTWTGLGLT